MAKKPSTQRDAQADRLWVEETAMLLEAGSRFPRTAGRILAWMLISPEELATQAELAQALEVSQASVSTALRFLVDTQYVERTRSPGVRRDQYRLRDQSWSAVVHAALQVADSIIRHLERGLTLPGPDLYPGRVHLTRLTSAHRVVRDLMREAATRIDAAERAQ